MRHPNTNAVDRDMLETYAVMFKLEWEGSESDNLAYSPIPLKGTQISKEF